MITDEQRGQITRYSSDIERRLKERLGAEGKGIRELADSVQTQLTDEIYHHIRFIARDRNAAVHGDADKSIDMNRYIDRCESVILLLEKLEKNEAVESLPEWSAKCLFCGRVISKKAEQCPSCKQVNPVYSRMQTCVDCGVSYREEYKNCPKCGRPKPFHKILYAFFYQLMRLFYIIIILSVVFAGAAALLFLVGFNNKDVAALLSLLVWLVLAIWWMFGKKRKRAFRKKRKK